MIVNKNISVNTKLKGKIFDIKKFATGDGPGIRTLVFFKGCPLRCEWCANPESQEFKTLIMYHQNKCNKCGKCLKICPNNAIIPDKKYGLKVNLNKCDGCQKCVDSCYYNALEIIGEEISVEELMKRVMRDKEFYDNSEGGVTLSGGEPLFQPIFTRELLKACKKERIHTAIETCGYTAWSNIKSIIPYVDLIYYDIKHIDSSQHKKFTGVDNKLIINNLIKLDLVFKNIIIRIPFVPGCNSEDLVQKKIYTFIRDFKNVKRIEIMPYHRLGKEKYFALGRNYKLKHLDAVEKVDLNYLIDIGCKIGTQVFIDAQ